MIALAVHPGSPGLEHPTRRRIYAHLLRLPGDHFRSIVRSLHLGLGTATYHLDVLARAGLVGLKKENGRCRYYPKGQEAEPGRNQLFMRHWNYRDLRLRVLLAVARLPGASVGTIGRQLGISRQLATYHLARLQDLSIVRREGRCYRVPPGTVESLLGLPEEELVAPLPLVGTTGAPPGPGQGVLHLLLTGVPERGPVGFTRPPRRDGLEGAGDARNHLSHPLGAADPDEDPSR